MDDLGIALEPLGTLEMDTTTSIPGAGPTGTRVVADLRSAPRAATSDERLRLVPSRA